MHKRITITIITIFMLILIIICIGIQVTGIKSIRLEHGAVLHIFPAHESNNNGKAIIICPGGSYITLKKWHEGFCWIPFYRDLGYAAAVLEYRMPHHDFTTLYEDGTDAMTLMRNCADLLGFDRNKVGIMGFSAGGHFAATLSVSEDNNIRPDFSILFYPVISMRKGLTHQLTHDMLLGINPSKDRELQFSNELHVSEKIPPTYIIVSKDDTIVSPQNAICYHNAIKSIRRSSTLHIYPDGNHGWGINKYFKWHQKMLDDLKKWLERYDREE